jgi:hypothetical protein
MSRGKAGFFFQSLEVNHERVEMDIKQFVKAVGKLKRGERVVVVGNGALIHASSESCTVYEYGKHRLTNFAYTDGPLSTQELLKWLSVHAL